MKATRAWLYALLLSAISLAPASPLASPKGIDEVHIDKSEHTLELRKDGVVVKSYKVALGSGGAGPKEMEGDKKTPVGRYFISSRIKGLFHQFLTVSYPNAEDKRRYAELKKQGLVPAGRGVGFGIGIHGVNNKDWAGVHKESDWTFGCIALDDDEIDEIAKLVPNGTAVVIED